jgi:Ca2+-binding EF-hand superfamily protein
MKFIHAILTVALLACALPVSLHAAKDPAKKEAKKAAKQAITQYDKNSNGSIDGDEVTAVQTAFTANPTGPLKAFDTDNDGKLDTGEVAAIKAGKKGGKGAKKKNKNA